MSSDFLVVVPTYNEARTIDEIIKRTFGAAPDAQMLIVDDASPDGTGSIAEEHAHKDGRVSVLHRPEKRGLGRAYLAGFAWGMKRDFAFFLEMDADLSHDPGAIPQLISAAGDSDLVIGSRYIRGGEVTGWSPSRLWLSRAGNVYARLALGFGVRDSTSGFRCYRRELLEEIGLESVTSDGYAFQIDMAYRAWKLGFRIKEVPITFAERAAGISKISRAIVLEAIALVAVWGARDRVRDLVALRRKPRRRLDRDKRGA